MTETDRTLDGIPVSRSFATFDGKLTSRDIEGEERIGAGRTFAAVVLVTVGDIIHHPGDDDDLRRENTLQVTRMVIPGGELEQHLLGIIRGVASSIEVPVDAPWIAYEPDEGSAPAPAKIALLHGPADLVEDDDPIPTVILEAAAEPEEVGLQPLPVDDDDRVARAPDDDDDDDFLLPSPAPDPEGTIVLGRVESGDPALRKFFSERING